MARQLRIQYPGAVYHITCRGNERKEIFKNNNDRETFIKLLIQSSRIYNVKIFSYVLMPNHFHLLVETPLGNLGEFMRRFNITYTNHYNRRHKRVGHLYQGRYKGIVVDREAYLAILSRYIHLNPVRARGMRGKEEAEKIEYLKNYEWSSLLGYINIKKKEEFIDYETVLEEYGGDNEKGKSSYRKIVFVDIMHNHEINDKIIGQSILGSEEFIENIIEKYLSRETDRECPPLRKLQSYKAKDEIIKAIVDETGKSIEEIRQEKGSLRQMVMDLLYRVGGLSGVEIGKILNVDYSTVSQERKRLRGKQQNDRKLRQLLSRLEEKMSRLKN